MSLRTTVYALMLAASVVVLAAGAVSRQRTAVSAEAQMQTASADLLARVGISLWETTKTGRPPTDSPPYTFIVAAQQTYQTGGRGGRPTTVDVRRAGILIGFQQGPEAAWTWFQQHPDPRGQALWSLVYGPAPLSQQQMVAALSRLRALDLHCYGELVRWQLYHKAGETRRAQAVLEELQERLRPGAYAGLAALTLFLAAAVVGVLLWLLFFLFRPSLRPPDRPLPFSSLAPGELAEAFILWFFALTVGGWAIRQAAGPSLSLRETPLDRILLLLLVTQVLAAAVGGYRLLIAQRGRELLPADPARLPSHIAWGIGAYMAGLPLLLLTALLMQRLLPDVPTPPNPAGTLGLLADTPWEWFLLLLIVAVAAPIFEELFFRGVLYSAIRQRASAAIAIVASAAAFAAVHPQLPLGFLPIFVLGALFASLVELRHSLVPSIVAHALNNGAILLMLALIRTPS